MTARGQHEYYALLLTFFLLFQFLPIQAVAGGVSWEQLSRQEKNILGHLKQRWNTYPAFKQKKMQRWARQPPAKRKLIKKRFQQWSGLSSSRKAKIKQQLKRYKRMSPTKRLKLKAWWRWFSRLPKHEQDKLNRKLPGMSQRQKREYIRQLEREYGKRS